MASIKPMFFLKRPSIQPTNRQIDRWIYIYRRAVENIVTFISFFLSMKYLMISLPGRNSTGDEVSSLPFTRRKGPHNLTLNKKNNKI